MNEQATIESALSSDAMRSWLRVDLHVLTPIHIGTREGRLGPTEFVVAGSKVHLIDENRLGRVLRDRNLIDAFITEVRKGPFQMASFLSKTARLRIPEDLHLVCSFSIPGGDPNMQDFRPFTRDAAGQLYIPGSSLKGVFRTALLYRFLKNSQQVLNSASSRIRADDSFRINKARKFYSHDWLQERNLQGLQLPGGREGPNTDILRCLTVRDAYPVSEVQTQVIKINFISRRNDGVLYWSQDKRHLPRDLFIWVEALVKGTFRMELSWDERLYSFFQQHNKGKLLAALGLNDLLNAVKQMNDDLVSHEKRFFNPSGSGVKAGAFAEAKALEKWYSARTESLFRVGFGSGMLSTTVGLALDDALRQKIRDACGSGPRPGDPAPKSRRVWKRTDTDVLPMGWLAIKAADPEKKPIPPTFKSFAGAPLGKETKRESVSPQVEGRSSPEPRIETPRQPEAQPTETWDQAEVRWDRGRNEVTATFQGKKAICRENELDETSRQLLVGQKKGKPFKARVTVQVLGDNYRKILKIQKDE